MVGLMPRWHNPVLREIAMYTECIRSLRRYLVTFGSCEFKSHLTESLTRGVIFQLKCPMAIN